MKHKTRNIWQLVVKIKTLKQNYTIFFVGF